MAKVYLVVTPFFPEPDNFRGPYVLDQVKAIQRISDYRVVVIKPYPFGKKSSDYEIDGMRVYRCPSWNLPSNIWQNKLCDYFSANSLKSKLKEIGVDIKDIAVCHTHVASLGFYALAIKKSNPNCMSVVQHHGFDVFGVTDGKLVEYKWHENHCVRYGRDICNAMDLNIGVSKKTLDYVKSYPGVQLRKEYVLYNGVDTTKFYPPQQKVKNQNFTVGCIANFWPLKDQMTLIRAVERLVIGGMENILVRFIGTGSTRGECETYVRENKLCKHFSFEDEVMHDQLLSFYQSLDLFILPSYWEAFGCVYTEAYACGVPFIAVKGQGISEIISEDDADRWLIDKGDEKKLAELIRLYVNGNSKQILSVPFQINQLVNSYLTQIEWQ